MLVTVQKRIEWISDGRRYVLTVTSEEAELVTPDGQCLSMVTSDWEGLALALEKALPKRKRRTKPFPAKPGAPNNGQPWDEALDAELSEVWASGAPLEETALHFGRTVGSISSRLIRLGLIENHDEARLRAKGAGQDDSSLATGGLRQGKGSFDYHRAMTDAVVEAPDVPPERLVWIMNETHRGKYRHFLEYEMGVDPDDSESFGIPIETGEPSNGEPFELIIRPAP